MIANELPKGLLRNLNESTRQIVLQPHRQRAKKFIILYRSLFYSKHSSFLIDSIKSASASKSKWGSLSRLLYKTSPPLFFYSFSKIPCLTNFLFLKKDDSSFPIFTKLGDASLNSFSPITLSELASFFYPIILELIKLSLTTAIFFSTLKNNYYNPTN